jgi:cathepsin A (carboxypeptidase C)/serine carboxypeptidase-like clade 2
MRKICGTDIGCVFTGGNCTDACKQVLEEGIFAIQEDDFNPYFIYGDKCLLMDNQATTLRRSADKKQQLQTTSNRRVDIVPCADTFTQAFLNQKSVQEAIHVTDHVDWVSCSGDVSDTYTSSDSSLPKYHNILGKGLNVLIYSGDADSVVNFIGTERWIGEEGLKLRVTDKWTAWFGPDKQLAGYVQGYEGLTFKTVKGAGHMVPAVKPLHGLNLFECFVFGDDACATFDYPKDEEELQAGAFTELHQTASAAMSLSSFLSVVAVGSVVAVFLAVGMKSAKKRADYAIIRSPTV